jgi:hypothetical protein
MIIQKYNKCVYCGSNNLRLYKKQNFTHNFYTGAIKNDLRLTDNFFKKMKVYNCKNCNIIQNNPWFSKKMSFKIFNQIYGQHNRNWSNVINFFQSGTKPDHGKLFDIIEKNINVKNYCEFNVPFMGLMIDFFDKEYNKNLNFYKNIFDYSLNYLSSRQVAGLRKFTRSKKQIDAKIYLAKLNKLKNKIKKKNIKKSIVIDNSYLGWLYNDNYKSVNSRSLASELFDIEIENLDFIKNSKKYDLFGIFHTLDHTHQPKKILDYALNNSRYVLIYFHSDENLEKQHLFTFTDKFIPYLKKKNIFCKDLTLEIDKNFKSKEIYCLCSKFNKINFKY